MKFIPERKIHEKLVFDGTPRNSKTMEGIRAYLNAVAAYGMISQTCGNSDFELKMDIEMDNEPFETQERNISSAIHNLGNDGGFIVDITSNGKFADINVCSENEVIKLSCFPDEVPSIFDCLKYSGEKGFRYGKMTYYPVVDIWESQYIDGETCMDNALDFGDIIEKKTFNITDLWNSELFLVILFDFEKYPTECEEIKSIIEKYIDTDNKKPSVSNGLFNIEIELGVVGVQWIPNDVDEIVEFTEEINKVLSRIDKNDDLGMEAGGLFCNISEFFAAQIYADNEDRCLRVVAVKSAV